MTRYDSTATTSTSPNRGAHAHSLPMASLASSVEYRQVLLALVIVALAILGPLFSFSSTAAQTGTPAERVYVVPIHGTIEPGIGAFLDRSFSEAEDAGASAVILDINTPGGRLDTVLEMRDSILGSPLRIIAFVNREAFSAGALITIASDEIWLAPGGVFGAATPVLGTETASEKTVSAVRSTFRATAEETGRDPDIAEAMVDPVVEIEGLDSSTTLLTLSTEQALAWDYADGVAQDLPALLTELGLEGATITEMSLSPIEQLVRWITDPLFASLLITGGLFLIIADALFAGFGVAAAAGIACLGLFFWGHNLAGLAGWEDLLLVILGIVLIAVEVFVIPGFGVAGILGIVTLAGGLILAMSGRGPGNFELTDEVVDAGWVVAISLGLVLVALVALSLITPRALGTGTFGGRSLGGISLAATVDRDDRAGKAVAKRPSWLVRQFGGQGVLERGDLHMPDAPRPETPGEHPQRRE